MEAAEDDDPVMRALADYRATLAEVRAAIPRAGDDNADALIRAVWRVGASADAIHALARQRIMAREVAEQAVADYRASLQPAEPRLTVVRPA